MLSSNATNAQPSRDSLGKVTWVRSEFLTQAEISDIQMCKKAYEKVKATAA